MTFWGRNEELNSLKHLLKNNDRSSLVVLRGRRRIGKSRLIREFGKMASHYLEFSGLPPEKKLSPSDQRHSFAKDLERLGVIGIDSGDWENLFIHLFKFVKTKRTVVLLDEISWMAHGDPTFIPKLKKIHERYLTECKGLILVLCGSISSWIGDNILSSTGFHGRIALDLVLRELELKYCGCFWDVKGQKNISAYEKFKLLSITGGIPRYLEDIDPKESAEKNILRMCFTESGILFNDFERIFSDIFQKKQTIYKDTVNALIDGPKTFGELCKILKWEKSGTYSGYIHHLILAGFVTQDTSYKISSIKYSKIARNRLSDNYLRFYLKNILPIKQKVISKLVSSVDTLNWHSILGMQFENLILSNRKTLCELANIDFNEITTEGPYWQTKNSKQEGVQIDYLVASKFSTLYLFEIKFSETPIGSAIIQSIEEKIRKLTRPKRFSVRPILVHVGGVTEEVLAAQYFYKLIDFSDFFNH